MTASEIVASGGDEPIAAEAAATTAAVLAEDFRHLLKFAREHEGDQAVIDRLIADMASYRARVWVSMMVECFNGGQAEVEARIAEALGEVQ